MRFILTLLLVSCFTTGFSCYNEYYALDAKGNFHPIEMDKIRFNQFFDQKDIEKQLIQLERKLQKSTDFRLLSDYGLHLVQAGKVEEALILFGKLAELHPNEYSIIANLGTTYELSGQNEKALEYIKKGIQINPNSHKGSEWIHVKILEAKIALEKDPDYLEENSVLNLNPQQKKSQKVFDQLYIQLQERFPFSPKEANPVMADLFVEMGDFYFDHISYEHAKAFYQIAKLYYKSARKDIDEKIERARTLRETYSGKEPGFAKDPHGTTIKVVGVPYQNYIHNPAGSDYKIDWSKIETDPETLLAYGGIATEEKSVKMQAETIQNNPEEQKNENPVSEKESDNSMLWIGLTLAILIIAIFTYFRAKKK